MSTQQGTQTHVQLVADGRYGCWNRTKRPGKTVVIAPDGYPEDGRRKTRAVVTHWESIACGHSERASDERCVGRMWRDVE